MNTSSDNLGKLIADIKRRWVMRALKQGGAVIVLTFLLCSALYLLLLHRYELSPFWQIVMLAGSLAALIAGTVLFIVRPLFTRFSDRMIALFIEEKFPELEDRLNSAVEIGTSSFGGEKDALVDMLIEDAARKAGMVRISTVVDRRKQQILTYAACSLFVLAALFVMSFRSELGTIASRMVFIAGPGDYRPEISIRPGDVQIETGESQEILVTLRRESSGDVILHYRTGSDIWRKETMIPGLDRHAYMYRLAGIQEPVTYYVEFRESMSPEYFISIYEYPKVARIDLEYSYPAYTGMPGKREENTGNIRGLKGSEVILTVTATGTVETGELVLDDSRRIPLSPQGGGVFSGALTIGEYGAYHVFLTDAENKNNKFPEEYLITPVEDEPPLIAITDPKRDMRVNPVEEVLIAAQAEDDFGLTGMELKYSVNGGDEQPVDLAGEGARGLPEVSGSHVMYLEDFALEPGDIISYYVAAADNFHADPSVTDMYFIEITPFDTSYSQASNQQDGPQQGGPQQGGSQMVMSQQMIIAATWKLYRLRNDNTAGEFDESLDALVQAQANLMYNIGDRVNSTSMSQEMVTDDDFLAIADLLRSAVEEMGAAVETLMDRDLMEALKPEQRALNHLLKADAMNREKQVQRNRQASQSGASGQSSEERMTELMDLELDISKDKYEIQQQTRSRQAQEMDDAMERLRELAERQQALADENRGNLLRQEEEDSRRFLDRLQRDQEELRRQAEELSGRLREMSRNDDRMSRQMRERVERVAETMRRAEEDLKSGDVQESMARQQQALNELNRIQQDLRFSMTDDAREMLREFGGNFDRLREREEQLARALNDTYDETMGNNGRIPDASEIRDLTRERRSIRENLQILDEQARAIEEQTLQEHPDIATDMRNIRNAIRRENLERLMAESERFLENGWLSYSLPVEAAITGSLDSLGVRVDQLAGSLPVTGEEQLSRSLAGARDMRQRLEDMMARGRQSPEESRASPGSEEPSRADGQQNGNQQQARNRQADQQQQSGEFQEQGRQQSSQDMNDGGNGERDTALQLERLMDQFGQLLDGMAHDFGEDPEIQQTIDGARRAAASAFAGEFREEDVRARLQEAVFDPLAQIEMHLLRRLDDIDLERKLYSARSADVPAEYKTMVDRYFESIAKQNATD